MDRTLLDATEAILEENGVDGVSLERVAERVRRSRVTLWRQGVTKEGLITGLLQRLTDDFLQEFWPVLNSPGSGRERLADSLKALFEVADRNLNLLAISDEVFHWAAQRCHFPADSRGFLEPFIGALHLGARDGTVTYDGRTEDTADVLFNAACWGYVHLRRRHQWARNRARTQLTAILLPGLAGAKK